MSVSTKNEVIKPIDVVTTKTHSKLKPVRSKKLKKQARMSLPVRTLLNNTLELMFTILIIASILGIYIASGLHERWIKLVGQIM
jgi:hypothetical protein